MELPVDLAGTRHARTFREFDHAATAPLHGFKSAAEYYYRNSCGPWLSRIETETLILQARDDPFLPVDAIPNQAELGGGVVLELSAKGGHVGFVAGNWPFRPCFWLEKRILARLGAELA